MEQTGRGREEGSEGGDVKTEKGRTMYSGKRRMRMGPSVKSWGDVVVVGGFIIYSFWATCREEQHVSSMSCFLYLHSNTGPVSVTLRKANC